MLLLLSLAILAFLFIALSGAGKECQEITKKFDTFNENDSDLFVAVKLMTRFTCLLALLAVVVSL